jgi:hypothetical protein
MKKLIKRILREEIEKSDKHYRILDKISDHVHLPYFKSMESLTIDDEDDQLYIMKKIYGYDIYFHEELRRYIYNDNNDKRVYSEDVDGHWWIREYDEDGEEIYFENSDGSWQKKEYDDKGNQIYYEDSDGSWQKKEYDDKGNLIYYEDSNGKIIDRR